VTPWGTQNLPLPKLNSLSLWSAQLIRLHCATCKFFLTIRTYRSTSCNMSGPKTFCSPILFPTMGFGTYNHIASQMLLYSISLSNYCYRRTRRTVDSYSNFFCTTEHMLLSISSGYDLLARPVHWSEGDKQNWSSNGYPKFHATSPRTWK
jgi:hypothetical protein